MAVDAAKTLTTAGTAGSAVKNRYYDKLFLRIAEAKLVHKQLGQVNRSIAQGEGGYGTGVLYWTKWTNLPVVSAGQGEGVPTTAVAMTASNVTGTTAQYDAAVSISDILAYTSFGDVMKAAMERLAYNAGISIDTAVRNAISLSGTFQGVASSTLAAYTAVPATATLNVAEIRKAVRTLRRNDAFAQSDGYFVSVIHPDSLYDLMADTSTGSWVDVNKYTDTNVEKIFKGEVGRLAGVRFLETSNGYVRGSGVTASSSIYMTSIFGSDSFGVSELQNLKTYVKGFESGGTGDPTEKVATAGWKTTFGAAMLNSSFAVNIQHTVTATA